MLPTKAVLLAFLLLLTAAGIYLAVTGLYPRRHGDTRFCRRCGYNLTGNLSGRCPECGSRLGRRRGVVVGESVRRPVRATLGIILLLPGLASVTLLGFAKLKGVDPYQHLPARLLIRDLRSENPRTFRQASQEVLRRLGAQQLSATQLTAGVTICLDRFGRMRLDRGFSQEVIDLLGDLHGRGALDAEQTERFYEQTVKMLRVETRPTLLRGNDCPLVVSHEVHLPSSSWCASVVAQSIRVDDRVVEHIDSQEIGDHDCGSSQGYRSPLWFRLDEPGRHTIAVDFEITLHADASARFLKRVPLHRRIETLETSIEVLADEPPGYIKMRSSPGLDARVASLVSIGEVQPEYQPGFGLLDGVSVGVEFQPGLPIDVAFEVFVEVDREWYFVGTVAAPRGNTTTAKAFARTKLTPRIPEHVTIQLEATPRAAERTLDMYEIGGGKLRFEYASGTGYLDPAPFRTGARGPLDPTSEDWSGGRRQRSATGSAGSGPP